MLRVEHPYIFNPHKTLSARIIDDDDPGAQRRQFAQSARSDGVADLKQSPRPQSWCSLSHTSLPLSVAAPAFLGSIASLFSNPVLANGTDVCPVKFPGSFLSTSHLNIFHIQLLQLFLKYFLNLSHFLQLHYPQFRLSSSLAWMIETAS